MSTHIHVCESLATVTFLFSKETWHEEYYFYVHKTYRYNTLPDLMLATNIWIPKYTDYANIMSHMSTKRVDSMCTVTVRAHTVHILLCISYICTKETGKCKCHKNNVFPFTISGSSSVFNGVYLFIMTFQIVLQIDTQAKNRSCSANDQHRLVKSI